MANESDIEKIEINEWGRVLRNTDGVYLRTANADHQALLRFA